MRRIRSTCARETGGRGTPPDPVLHIDALAAPVGHQPKPRGAVRPRSGRTWRRDAARYSALFREAWLVMVQRDCQSAVLTLFAAGGLHVFPHLLSSPVEVV